MEKPLQGLRVVDLSTFVAAPCTGRLLADLGAEVIKIERAEGDTWRYTTISYLPTRFSHEENPGFAIYNSGKKFVTLNLKTEEGKEIFGKLLDTADVFVTNTRKPALKRLGIDYDSVKEQHPRLIYAMVTGYGDKGPDAGLPAFDTTSFWSRCGMPRDMVVKEEGQKFQPFYPPAGVGDTVSAFQLTMQINAALYQREKTGKGQFVEASLFHNGIFTFGSMVIANQRPFGRQYPTTRVGHSCPGGFYECSDGEFVYIGTSKVNDLLGQMARATGRMDVLEDERFSTLAKMRENKEALYALFKEEFLKKTSFEWERIAKEQDFALSRMRSFSDVCEDEQAWANDFLEHVEFQNGNVDVMPSSPIHMETVEGLKTSVPGLPGCDNEEVLKGLGYTDEQIAALSEKGVTATKLINK